MLKVGWSARKNRLNILKHRIDFEDAKTIFDDPNQATINDPDHSLQEERYITIGRSTQGRLIIMAHTFEDAKIRIISARKPTRAEREKYEEGNFDA